MENKLTPEEEQLKQEFEPLLAQFSEALLDKLLANERKHQFGNSWKTDDWEQQLQRDLLAHVAKGDPRDVAIYAFFAWQRGWPTAPPVVPAKIDVVRLREPFQSEKMTLEYIEHWLKDPVDNRSDMLFYIKRACDLKKTAEGYTLIEFDFYANGDIYLYNRAWPMNKLAKIVVPEQFKHELL